MGRGDREGEGALEGGEGGEGGCCVGEVGGGGGGPGVVVGEVGGKEGVAEEEG